MRCLGKKPVRHDVRTLWLRALMPTMPDPPPARDWSSKLPADVGMYLNDQLGDCTCASMAHLIQTWTSQIGLLVNPSDKDVIAAYERQGYDPSDPATDGGAVMLDVLNDCRKNGLGGHKIGAYIKIDHHDIEHVKAAIDYFGGAYLGVQLPTSAQNLDADWVGPESTTGSQADRPGGWGGHCMAAVAYDRLGVTFLTWGKRQRADWTWWRDYVDEAYAIVSADWLDPSGVAPNGLPVAQLNSFLMSLV